MQQKSVDLSSLFSAAASELAARQQTINQADAYNGDHGTNMVQTFQTISSALEKKKGSSASTALNYAAKQVGRNTHSGSGQMYAENLYRAAAQFKGRQVDQRGALDLLMTLIGGQGGTTPAHNQSQPVQNSSADEMLGALLGGTGASQTNQAPAAGGDMLGSLLGGLTGAQGGQAGGQPGLGMGDLLNAGMAFMQAKQSGGNTQQALMQAFMAGSGMGQSPHREESTATVVNSFLQALAQGK